MPNPTPSPEACRVCGKPQRLDALERAEAVVAFLRIYIHAHKTDNAVPPHIERDAMQALADYDKEQSE